MPELPEVESTVRRIKPDLVSHKIITSEVLWHRTLATHKELEFNRLISETKIFNISRRGKYIIIELTNKYYILVHLRMSGHLEVRKNKIKREPHDRLIINLSKDKYLAFNDPRKFGKFYLVDDPNKILSKLGPEPTDKIVTPEYLHNKLKNKKTRIKSLLLDQTWLAGLGNIYADEVLWRSKIHPLRRANKVTKEQAMLLAKCAREVISEAINLGGTDFGDGVVPDGRFLPKTYGREGESCKRCNGEIKRITVAQRSSYFCRGCQR